MKRIQIAIATLFAIMIAAPAFANTTSYWTQAGIPQFYKGKFSGTALTDDGRIVLGSKIDRLYTSTEPYLWSLVYDAKGALWAGSGNKAILYKIDKKNDATESAVLPGSGISALAADKDNNVYAAVFPGGAIYVIKPGKKAEQFAQVPATYIWDMKFGTDGGLYCVTGIPAGAHRISKDGQIKTLYMSQSEKHFLSFFLDGDKFLYTGTSPNGLVLRINLKEALKEFSPKMSFKMPMADPEENMAKFTDEEIDSESDAADADMETATDSTDDFDAPSNLASEPEPKSDPRITVIVDLEEDEAYRLLPWKNGKFLVAANSDQIPPAPQLQKRSLSRPEPLSFPLTSPAQKMGQRLEPARLYVVDQSGQTRKALEIPDPFILSLQPLGGDKVLVGTGNNGRIYTLDIEADDATLQEVEAKQILAIAGEGETLRLATGNPGAVFAPRSATVTKGVFTSSINDASTPAIYGNLDAAASVPKKSSLEFKTRTGNTPNPMDGTWSEWSSAEGRWPFKITSPTGRYIQFSAQLQPSPDNKSPELREVKLYYLTANQPPQIDNFTVLPAPQLRQPTAPPVFQQNSMQQSDMPQMPQMPTSASVARPASQPISSPSQNYVVGVVVASDDITLRWSVSDPDHDNLRFTLFFRMFPSDTWTLLQDKIYDTEYRWKIDSLPDGRYEVKLAASDIESNSEDRAESTEEISDPLTIDHSRPNVTINDLKKNSLGYIVTGSATDGTCVVAKIEYSL
ncbi:MAG: hypothetical protein WCX65_16345, partial [bacterium]